MAEGIPTLIMAASSLDDVLAITGFGISQAIAFAQGDVAIVAISGPLEVLAGAGLGVCLAIIFWLLPPPGMVSIKQQFKPMSVLFSPLGFLFPFSFFLDVFWKCSFAVLRLIYQSLKLSDIMDRFRIFRKSGHSLYRILLFFVPSAHRMLVVSGPLRLSAPVRCFLKSSSTFPFMLHHFHFSPAPFFKTLFGRFCGQKHRWFSNRASSSPNSF